MPFDNGAVPSGLAPQVAVTLDITAPVPPFSKLFEAAFSQENPYVSAGEALREPAFTSTDPSYDPFTNLSGYEDYASAFIGANSAEDVSNVKGRIDRERARRDLLASGGWRGIVASIGAGLADPLILVPVGGELVAVSRTGRVLEGIARAAGAAGVTSAAQETALQASQLTRPLSESAEAVALSTLIGGVAGGALARFGPVGREAAASAARAGETFDNEVTGTITRQHLPPPVPEGSVRVYHGTAPGETPTAPWWVTPDADHARTFRARGAENDVWYADLPASHPALVEEALGPGRLFEVPEDVARGFARLVEHEPPAASTAGAAAVRDTTLDQETVARSLGLDRALAFSSPTLRMGTSPSVETRRIGQELADQPLVLRKNVEGVPSPVSVERRASLWMAPLAQAMVGLDDLFVKYRLGRARQRGDLLRLGAGDLLRAQSALSYDQFAEAVGRAMRRGDTSTVPEVAEAARLLRAKVFDPLKEHAQRLGMLPEDVAPSGAASYLTRVYNTPKIAAQRPAFEEVLSRWLARVPEFAKEWEVDDIARQITDQLLSMSPGRTVYAPVPLTRGPLRERTLNIPDELIEPWLESDVRRIARAYTRTLATDTELVRRFGRADMQGQLDAVREHYATLRVGVSGEAELRRLDAAERGDLRDIEAVRDRIRGTYGLPEDPNGFWNRAYHVVRDLNYLRLLGGMTLSAFPDLGRAVMVHGVMRVVGDGLVPMLRDFRAFRLAAEEVKLAGNALDMVLDTRAMGLADVMDDYGRWSKYERGLQAVTGRFGMVSLMAPWNAAMKQFAAVVSQTRALKAIDALSQGKALRSWERARLASLGIGVRDAERIAGQFERYGERGGVWWANTARWDDTEMADLFRAALSKEVDTIIVTPGQERPLWTSRGIGRVIGQFKSFSFASTQRVLMTGLQQRDMAALNGALLMVALGMLTWRMKKGLDPKGKELPDPETPEGLATWVREGVDQAGLLGWMFDAHNIVEKATRGAVGLSRLTGGAPMSRYASRSVVESLLGPTAGFLGDAAQAVGALSAGEFTEGDLKSIRRMVPLQNLIEVRWLFDQAEEGLAEAVGAR